MLLQLLKNGLCDVCTGRRCSAKESVFGSLLNFFCLEKRSGMNRIGHPDWVKLCVELSCAPNQNTFCYKRYSEVIVVIVELFAKIKRFEPFIILNYLSSWCNGYRRRKWTRRHEFKSWTKLIVFHIALIPLGKV